MKRLLDINTWIALAIETHPLHPAARGWYEAAPLAAGDLVFCPSTEMGFLRLVTQAAVMSRCGAAPLTNREAISYLQGLYANPALSRVAEPTAMRSLWLQLADNTQSAPNTWMDAYLAAFAISLDAEMVTFDRGFNNYRTAGLNLHLLEAVPIDKGQ